jgi:hypothetical protein
MVSRRHFSLRTRSAEVRHLGHEDARHALCWSIFDLLPILMQVRVVSVRLRKVFSRRRRFTHARWLVPEVELQFPITRIPRMYAETQDFRPGLQPSPSTSSHGTLHGEPGQAGQAGQALRD